MGQEVTTPPFETDENGDLIVRPVIGWQILTFAETALLVAIQYSETPEEPENSGKWFQLAMTPPQALELAERLTEQAQQAMKPLQDKKPN